MALNLKLKETWTSLWNEFVAIIPTILLGLLLVVIGWIVAKLVSKIIFRILEKSKDSKLSKMLNLENLSDKIGAQVDLSNIISRIAYWVIFLFFIVAATETVGWSNVSKEVSIFIKYLPKILSALLIFIIGYSIAKFVKTAVKNVTNSMGIGLGNVLSEILFYFLILIVTLTALAQAEVNTSIISANLYILFGSFGLSIAIALGLGSRPIVTDLLKNHYNRSAIEEGMLIEIDGIKGTVVKISKSLVIVDTGDEKVVFPSSEFYENRYKILK